MPSKTTAQLVAFNIKRLRRERHLTQGQLAERMGVAQSTLCDIESGRHACTGNTLDKLADALGVSQMEFLLDRPQAIPA